MLMRMGESRHPCLTPTVVQNQPPMLPLKRTAPVALSQRCLITLVRLALILHFSGKVGTDIVVLHCCPQICIPTPVKGLLEVSEDMVKVLLVLEIFLTKCSRVEDLLCGAPSCSEFCLFFSTDPLLLRLQSVQYDLQHDFALVADETDHLVVLALLHVAFLGRCDDQGLDPKVWSFSCLQYLVADCSESSDYYFSNCLDQFCLDVGKSS